MGFAAGPFVLFVNKLGVPQHGEESVIVAMEIADRDNSFNVRPRVVRCPSRQQQENKQN
jgi:hypothetical protein